MRQDLIELVRERYKLAASKSTMQIGNARAGRRPMSVDTLLRKEKEGTLYKRTEAIKNASQEAGVTLPGGLGAPFAKGRLRTKNNAPVDHVTNRLETSVDDVPDEQVTSISQLEKMGEDKPVTFDEAAKALKSLARLEKKKLTKEDLMQSAASGAITAGIATPAAGLVSGSVPAAFKEGYGDASRKGFGKVRGAVAGSHKVLRGLAGAATGSAVFGAALPLVRQELARRAEKEKLKEYLGLRPSTSLRGKIRKSTGV